jgi:hypothetical protein
MGEKTGLAGPHPEGQPGQLFSSIPGDGAIGKAFSDDCHFEGNDIL